jgi:hypothetical protein
MITKKYKALSFPMEKNIAHEFEVRLVVISVTFLLVFALSFISLEAAMIGLIPLAIMNLYNRFIKKTK